MAKKTPQDKAARNAKAAEADAAAIEAQADEAAEGADSDGGAAAQIEEVAHERLEEDTVSAILEASLQAAESALTVDQCLKLFRRGELPVSHSETQRELIRRLLDALAESYDGRGIELKRVASGYRLQVRQDYARWVSRLWEEKPPRYSRALLETLSLIAYRQPVTRGDIEQVRGVAVSQNIVRTLSERGWIREVGHREVPGRPALYGTTKAFLDYFNLKSLSELPPLEEIRELIEPVVVEEVAAPTATEPEGTADDPIGDTLADAVTEAALPEAADPDDAEPVQAEATTEIEGDDSSDEPAADDPVVVPESGAEIVPLNPRQR